LYSSPHINTVTKLRIVRWAGHVVCMIEREMCTQFYYEINHAGNIGVGGRVILKLILGK